MESPSPIMIFFAISCLLRKVQDILLNITMESSILPIMTLPAGFRFHPTDEELIVHYLKKKVSSSSENDIDLIADIDLYKFNPWELPGKALFGESEWFFFSPRDRKYPNGARPNRAAASGYWKAIGTDKPILSSTGSRCIGVKKALVFYRGRPQNGSKTNWMMDEYRVVNCPGSHCLRLRGSMRLDDWVLCRIRKKSNTSEKDCSSSSNTSSISSDLEASEEIQVVEKVKYLEEYGWSSPPQKSEVGDDQPNGPFIDFHGITSAQWISDTGNSSHTDMVRHSVEDALDTIRRVLSV
ncbi:hypothetical protein RJ639_047711 [Escallonia herrerae]|uniref:NAC domain-containing protein n=1 Tax=Escallonia herrerae TaxID=1293975 RepID=A0AA88W348_9ASTE|nr:hypothetical protein RJ639_047711 [Escallonia herrerae]